MEFEKVLTNLPNRSDAVKTAFESLNTLNAQVSGVFLKFLLLIRIDSSKFEPATEEIKKFCEENCRYNSTIALTIQNSLKRIEVLGFMGNDEARDLVFTIAALPEIPTIIKWFDSSLIPLVSPNGEAKTVGEANELLGVNDSVYMIKVTKTSQWNSLAKTLMMIHEEHEEFKRFFVMNLYKGELAEFKFSSLKPKIEWTFIEEKYSKYYSINDGQIFVYNDRMYSNNSKNPDLKIFGYIVRELLNVIKENASYSDYSKDIYVRWSNVLEFEKIETILKSVQAHESFDDEINVEFIIAEHNLRRERGITFIELAVLENINRRLNGKPIFKWNITSGDLYKYCISENDDKLSDYSEDPIDMYIVPYSGFNIPKKDLKEFLEKAVRYFERYEDVDTDMRRGARASIENVRNICGSLEDNETDEETDVKFEREILRRAIERNQRRIEEAYVAIERTLVTGRFVKRAMYMDYSY